MTVSGSLIWVDEQGPELFVPRTPGVIVPNGEGCDGNDADGHS